ncbi:MAG: NAD(P)/FAD-dependent oxidoreductase [Verrucomicrobia bacterium]|nr:NAD(P)/FAD-dependent oxidoreductase [Verrucomicrobiota bacterium]
MESKKRVVIVGGGAAGIFAAALLGETTSNLEILVLEKTRQLLSKVRISGGGRCNVTHSQFDPKKLTASYPRGNKELLGPFHRFQPQDTIAWFAKHGVELKTEEDGRMFPVSDHSATIINCLLDAAKEGGVEIRNEHGVRSVERTNNGFRLHLDNRDPIECHALILASGSSPNGHELAASLGHTIVSAVPSLFTFNVPSSPLLDLAGIAVPDAELSLKSIPFRQRGSLLITHWGFSGPAALKLSAWAARDLHACNYRTDLHINWIPSHKQEDIFQDLLTKKRQKPLKNLEHENLYLLPLNLWKRLMTLSGIPFNSSLGHVPDKNLKLLSEKLTQSCFAVEGKTTYKSEFVTCGGIELKEVDFKTLESKVAPHLFFAGEILNIDGVTGGFNFQNAWTTAYLAASCIADRFR